MDRDVLEPTRTMIIDLYVDQSAVYNARKMNTPLLLLHGVEDGSVEWLTGIEFYNALRFNGKNVILLSYPGEDHHLAKWENQVDFMTRMEQFMTTTSRANRLPNGWLKGCRS
jgi:dipeptidyl aminopeptidase/acylaminoacyl peptidase